jgi:hypothetical protein
MLSAVACMSRDASGFCRQVGFKGWASIARQEDNVQDRHASPIYLANYLAMEWGDVLFPKGHVLVGAPDPREELDENRVGRERVERIRSFYSPGTFYREVTDRIVRWCAEQGIEPRRSCDIGGSTGRLVYELYNKIIERLKIPPLEFLLVEQSATFCHWAQRFLRRDSEGAWGISPTFAKFSARSPPKRLRQKHDRSQLVLYRISIPLMG